MVRLQRLSSLVLAIAIHLGVAEPLLGWAGSPFWPQWRGPDRTDRSDEQGLLRRWPEGGPARIWLFRECGIGYSGPAIVGDRLFIMGARDRNDQLVEQLICLDAPAGQELWSTDLGDALQNNWGDGPRGTPTVDQALVFSLSGQGVLLAARVSDGRPVWQRTMQELGGTTPKWGYTESVLVDGDRVICTPGGPQGAICALDRRTGDILWQSREVQDPAQYASAITVEHDGVRQYVQLFMEHLVGVDARTGELLWQTDWPGQTAVIPTPIFHQGQVYITSGYGVGCKLIRLTAGHGVEEVYANQRMKNHHGGVILIDDHLYGYSDGVGWLCQEFQTGKRVWNEKSALGKGAIGYADGMFYCLSEKDGTVALVAATPEGWQEHGRFQLQPQTELRKPAGAIWTHPVIAGKRLYLRDQELLFCYDVAAD